MIVGVSPTVQALLATSFTWGVTAAGAALVFLVPRGLSERKQRMLLDVALGFAAGVMLAASFWSLLAPALSAAEASGTYGAHGYLPVAAGLLLGAGFVYAADLLIPHGAGDAVTVLSQTRESHDGRSKKSDGYGSDDSSSSNTHHRSSSSALVQQPPLTRTMSMSRKRNASSGRLSDAMLDAMEAGGHELPPPHHLSERQQSNARKLKQSPPPPNANAPLTRQGSRSGKKGSAGNRSNARISEMVALDEDGEYNGSDTGNAAGSELLALNGSSSSSSSESIAISSVSAREKAQSWHRILLLVITIVIHNFPEGLAVGVGFGALETLQPGYEAGSVDGQTQESLLLSAVGGNATLALELEAARASSYAARFAEARTLAFGIGLQNFPEGLAVSLPLLRVGYSRWHAFMYGQLSGMVEPIGGLLGAALISFMSPLLPYALSFAAGAMIFVVVEELIPETRAPNGFPTMASGGLMIGFVVMMAMDVGLG